MIGGISKCIINSNFFIGSNRWRCGLVASALYLWRITSILLNDIVEEDASQALPILDIMNFGV
jgi:hypothetical protein